MKRLLLILLLPVISFAGLKENLNRVMNDEFFERCIASVRVYNLSADSVLYSLNEKLLLHPASNMKVITSATALYFLGPDYRFKTSMYAGIDGDEVGDICFKGGCDPDFTVTDLDSMLLYLGEKGIKKINGNIYGDVSMLDSVFWGKGWMWDDDPEFDFPYLTPLILNDACVEVVYGPSAPGQKVIAECYPRSDFYSFTNTAVTTSADTSDITISRDWMRRGNNLFISGDMSRLEEEDTAHINLFNPAFYFLTVAAEHLNNLNISFTGEIDTLEIEPDSLEHIMTIERKLSDILPNLNKESDNLSAEMCLRALACENGRKRASAGEGIKMVDSLITLIGLDPEDYRIVDGSGVSHYNLVSTELLERILAWFYNEKPELYRYLYQSFPVAGIDGTLQNRMKDGPAYKTLHAKTGTLSGVSALSGYTKNADGDDIVFSIMTQNFYDQTKEARKIQDKICNIISGTGG